MTITLSHVLFVLFGLMVLGGAIAVVTVRNLFHAALWLMLVFFGMAGLSVLLEAPFFAAAQLFIYMGAIGILIIFAIMLTRAFMRQPMPRANEQWWLAALLAAVLLGVITFLILQNVRANIVTEAVPENTIHILGVTLVDPEGYALAFEVASVLLVMALIGAITIVRER
ncbi:MAG: NADH-quinone oxidoreductase subunit J [Anaerolineae bacterium]|jgi:NADH-quinone oxidoreductase subunit J